MGAIGILKDVAGGDNPVKKWLAIGKIILIIIVAFFVINMIVSFFKSVKKGSSAAGDLAGGTIIEHQTGVSVQRQQVCKEVAKEVFDSLHSQWTSPWTRYYWEDDEDIQLALNRLLTKEEAVLTSSFFRELASDSLKAVISQRLDQKEEDKVKRIVLENLV